MSNRSRVTNFVTTVINERTRGISAVALVMFPIFMLIGGGVLFNTFANAGFVTPAAYSPDNCSTTNFQGGPFAETCAAFQNYVSPCESNATKNCSNQGLKTSDFLNPGSPFTCIFTLSLNCFVQSINIVQTPQPFAFFNSNYNLNVFGICINVNGTAIGANAPGADSVTIQCNQDFVNSTHLPYLESYAFSNSTNKFSPNYNCTNYNDFSTYAGINYAYWGCKFIPSNPSHGNTTTPVSPANNDTTHGFILAVNGTQAGIWEVKSNAGGIHAVDVQGNLLIIEDPQSALNSVQCIAQETTSNPTTDCLAWLTADSKTNAQTGNAWFGLGTSLAFIGGVILTLIGLGMGIGAGGLTFNFSLSPNSQGTRLAQILGFGLLIFTPLFSEFGLWIETLPDNSGVVVSVFLYLMTFLGFYLAIAEIPTTAS